MRLSLSPAQVQACFGATALRAAARGARLAEPLRPGRHE
jgi:hypothetical protein